MRRPAWLLAASAVLSGCSFLANFDGLSTDYGTGDGGDGGGTEASAPYSGVRCGDAGCNPKSEVCCFKSGTGDDVTRGACGIPNCVGQDYAQCASATDCAHTQQQGSVCCFVLLENTEGMHYFAECVPPGGCDSGVLFCDPFAQEPCAGGGACTASTIISGLSSCGP